MRYNKINITFSDNHIPRDDIFDYHPIRKRNIYIIFLPYLFLSKGDIFLFYKFDKFEIDF